MERVNIYTREEKRKEKKRKEKKRKEEKRKEKKEKKGLVITLPPLLEM